MAFIKANAVMIGFGVICLLAVGATGWGVVAGEEIEKRLDTIAGVTQSVQGAAPSAVNRRVIEERKRVLDEQARRSQEAADVALAVQKNNAYYETKNAAGAVVPSPRVPLVEGALPKPENTVALQFRRRYAEALEELPVKLHAKDKPSIEDVRIERQMKGQGGGATGQIPSLWDPQLFGGIGGDDRPNRTFTKLDTLREWPEALAAYRRARDVRMYVTEGAFGRHRVADPGAAPGAVDIWQAQMSLWIQQDMAAALARCNDERAAELVAAGRPATVAYMPVKHLKMLAIDEQIGSESGGGGGSNAPLQDFAISFTGRENNQDYFVVPLQLALVIEEAAFSSVLEKLCGIGLYTPISVGYRQVTPNPTQTRYLYGSDPVVAVVIDLEAYFVHEVYKAWIPEAMAKANVLTTPKCAIEGGLGGGPRGTRFGDVRG